MRIKSAKFVVVVMLSSMLATPSYGRGFGGGGGFRGGGGGFRGGGFRSGGDGGRGFGRSDGGGFRGQRQESTAGGRFSNMGGDNRANFAHDNFPNRGQLPADGGFGNISKLQNRSPRQINQNDLSSQGKSIRNSFNNDTFNKTVNNYNVNRNGYGRYGYGAYHPYGYGWGYPGGWYAAGLSSAAMWTCAGVSTLSTFLGLASLEHNSSNSSQPASCNTVEYNGDNVYIDGQQAGSAQQYYQQAQQLAQTGQTESPSQDNSDTGAAGQSQQWQPLGVFALAEPGQTQSNMLLQLAIDKDGIVRGNYYNQLTNESAEVYGALDKKTQRVSWTIGTNPNTVFDAGLGDLVKDDSSVLVHYGTQDTSRMSLVRLQQPPQTAPESAGQEDAPNIAPQFDSSS